MLSTNTVAWLASGTSLATGERTQLDTTASNMTYTRAPACARHARPAAPPSSTHGYRRRLLRTMRAAGCVRVCHPPRHTRKTPLLANIMWRGKKIIAIDVARVTKRVVYIVMDGIWTKRPRQKDCALRRGGLLWAQFYWPQPPTRQQRRRIECHLPHPLTRRHRAVDALL